MKRKANPEALTDEEIAFLRSSSASAPVRQFVARQQEAVGVRTSAYRKVAAAARAEREALVEIAALEAVRLAAGQGDNARIAQLESDRSHLLHELDSLRNRLMTATALPALAVHSND